MRQVMEMAEAEAVEGKSSQDVPPINLIALEFRVHAIDQTDTFSRFPLFPLFFFHLSISLFTLSPFPSLTKPSNK